VEAVNFRRTLHGQKLLDDIVDDRPEIRTVRTDAKKPVLGRIGVAALALPEWLIEIEAIVVVDV
jgi:enamine deaminase RidA (YjgF/YER057c/UK114 family)